MSDRRNTQARRRGIGLIEAMISLALCAILLVAVATAYSASASAVETNDDFFRATHAARMSMLQVQTAIRRCDSCQVTSSTQLDVITTAGTTRRYKYISASRELRLITVDVTTDPDYVLAKNVTAVSFVSDSENDPDTGLSRVVRVTLTLDVAIGKEQIHLAGSAVPRRTVVY